MTGLDAVDPFAMTRHDDPTTTSAPTYEVHLRTAELPDTGMTSPVETDRIDFYDTGIWVTREDNERVFFPWDRVDMIREVPAAPEEAAATEAPATEEDQGPIV